MDCNFLQHDLRENIYGIYIFTTFSAEWDTDPIVFVNELAVKNLILTILPAKSDSDVMFFFLSYQGLIINRSLVY